ncbi:MAG: hypothetical protein LBF86_05100 [Helicobacteraceae bacterium]|jgi:hypothetical protein|nr:hypothetical protein [Helicobacteraceae bacterium]
MTLITTGRDLYDELFEGDAQNALRREIAKTDKSRAERLELFENNAKILREYVEREDFTNRSEKAQTMPLHSLENAEKVLAAAYEALGSGGELSVTA